MKITKCFGYFLKLAVILITAGCHSDSHEHQMHSSDESITETVEPQYFEGNGTIISIPPSKRHVMVKHGDIPGFMNAMTMPLFVLDTTLLRNVAPGDSIHFTIEESGNSVHLTKLEIIID